MKTMVSSRIKKMGCLMLASMMLMFISSMEVKAKENVWTNEKLVEALEMTSVNEKFVVENNNMDTRAMLYNCLISVYSGSSGMEVAFMTDCTQVATSVGVKDIVIKQKVWYGWKTVATSAGGQSSNCTTYMGTILYTNAIKGEEYRIICTHYADADEYTEVHGELDVIFTY